MVEHHRARRARVLLAMYDGGGNVPPLLAIARTLVARGHAVRVLAAGGFREPPSDRFRQTLAAAGCTVVPFRPDGRAPTVPPVRGLVRGWAPAMLGPLADGAMHRRFAASSDWAVGVVAESHDHPADVVASDDMLPGALVGAAAVGTPAVALVHRIYTYPAPGIPPFGPGFLPARTRIDRLRDAGVARMIARIHRRDALPSLNAARARVGLAPLRSVFAQYDAAARVLVLSSPAFDFRARRLPTNVRYVGLPMDDADADAAAPERGDLAGTADDPRPLVLVSMSTTPQAREQVAVIERVLAALAGLPVRGLVTLGPRLEPARFTAPPNVTLRTTVPHAAVLPETAVVVTHGGHGTTLMALAHGVPLLCLPGAKDQHDIAARVVAAGAGMRLAERADVRSLRRAMHRLLTEPRYRAAARRLAGALGREHGAEAAADEIERLAGR